MNINWRERIKKGMLKYAKKWAVPFTEENVMGFIKRCQKAQGYPLFTPLDKFYRCSCFGGEPITPGTIYFKDVPKDVADVLTVTVDRYDWLAHYFKTGKIAPHSSNIIIELDPSKENLERVEAQIKEASPDEQEKLRIFINNTRRTLGMPDYEDEISNEPKLNTEGNLKEVKKEILPKLEQLAEEARKYKSAEEFVVSPNFEYHLSSDPNLVGKTIESELVFTTKTPHIWSVQLQYERWGAVTPDELYLVWVKNPSKEFDGYYGHETASPPDEVKVIGKIGNINKLFGDEPISISVVEAIKKQQLTDFYNQVKMLGMPDYEDEISNEAEQNSEGNLEEPKYLWEEELIRYHFGGFGNKMYFLSGYLAILKDPAFSEVEKESAKKNVPEVFAWIKRKYDQIPFSELSKSPFYDDLKPLFEINKLLSALEEELERKPLDFDKIESILSKIRGSGKEYTKAVDKYYRELTGKDLGAATVETRALMEYRSKEQIEDQARWLKEQGIEPNSFEKAAMEYYGVSIPKEKPPPEEVKLEIPPELKLHAERAREYDTYEAYLESLNLPEYLDPDVIVKVFADKDIVDVIGIIRSEMSYFEKIGRDWREWLRSFNTITVEDNRFCIYFSQRTTSPVVKRIVDKAKRRGFLWKPTNLCRTVKLTGFNTLKEFWEAAQKEKVEEKVPEAWQMTKGSFLLSKYAADMKPREARKYHREQVEKAFKEDKPVPKEVLKDYPELVEKPPEVKEKEPNEEYARYIDRLRQLGVEIDKVPAIVEIGRTPTVIGKYDTYHLNFALGEISREDMPKFTTLTIKEKVWNVKKSTEAELLKIKLRKKLREEERREKQLKLREERRLETYENKGDGEPISLRDKLQLAFLEKE